ncbi:hypothetical protein L208DRAFT_926482 [Tricholoma matsutake]|nr:hypothetical protein L208DRAFT_926482 [Tricholoma matsutake 945]
MCSLSLLCFILNIWPLPIDIIQVLFQCDAGNAPPPAVPSRECDLIGVPDASPRLDVDEVHVLYTPWYFQSRTQGQMRNSAVWCQHVLRNSHAGHGASLQESWASIVEPRASTRSCGISGGDPQEEELNTASLVISNSDRYVNKYQNALFASC